MLSDWTITLEEVEVMDSGKSKKLEVGGCGLDVMCVRVGGGGKEYGSESFEGFAKIALSISLSISPKRRLLRRYFVWAEMCSWACLILMREYALFKLD